MDFVSSSFNSASVNSLVCSSQSPCLSRSGQSLLCNVSRGTPFSTSAINSGSLILCSIFSRIICPMNIYIDFTKSLQHLLQLAHLKLKQLDVALCVLAAGSLFKNKLLQLLPQYTVIIKLYGAFSCSLPPSLAQFRVLYQELDFFHEVVLRLR